LNPESAAYDSSALTAIPQTAVTNLQESLLSKEHDKIGICTLDQT